MNAPGRKTPEVASTTVAVELGEYEALKRERAILREIRRVAPLSYFMFDLEGGLRLQSDNLERLTGWTLEHVRTRHVAELVADGDMAGLMAAAQAAMRRPGEPVAFRYSMRCRDEGWIAVESAIVSLLDDPDIGGILGIGRVVDREQQLEGENAEFGNSAASVELEFALQNGFDGFVSRLQ